VVGPLVKIPSCRFADLVFTPRCKYVLLIAVFLLALASGLASARCLLYLFGYGSDLYFIRANPFGVDAGWVNHYPALWMMSCILAAASGRKRCILSITIYYFAMYAILLWSFYHAYGSIYQGTIYGYIKSHFPG
jgi:hypothetical protein